MSESDKPQDRKPIEIIRLEPAVTTKPVIQSSYGADKDVHVVSPSKKDHPHHIASLHYNTLDGRPVSEHFDTEGPSTDAVSDPKPMLPRAPAKPAAEKGDKATKGRTGRNKNSDDQIIAALCLLHKYDTGSVAHDEPAKPREIADKAGVTTGTISKFWKRTEFFGDYAGYCRSCRNKEIGFHLKMLNREFSELASLDPSKMDERAEESDE